MAQEIILNMDGFEHLFSKIKSNHILMVCDHAFDFLPGKVKNIYYSHQNQITIFNDFTPNPLYEQVCAGVKLFNDNLCDLIIAIGGGSTIDVAKCIKLYSKMDSSVNYLEQKYKDSGVPLIAIPTTAGTGSESTKYAVIYFEGKKQSVTHESIIPDYVILEPSVLKTLPQKQKKATMLDALCQGIESWWSVNSNDESKKYSRIAVETIVSNYKKYIFDNDDEAAKKIMIAANYAGRAINIAQTTAAHAMSYKLTSLYKLPHGHAVAVCLPVVWDYMLKHPEDCIDARGQTYLQNTFNEIPVNVNWFNSLILELDMNSPVSENRISEIETLVNSVNPVRLKNNPIRLSTEVLKDMYERIVK